MIRQALYDHLLAEKAGLLQAEGLPSAGAAWTFALHVELLRRLEAAQERGNPARLRKYLELTSRIVAVCERTGEARGGVTPGYQ